MIWMFNCTYDNTTSEDSVIYAVDEVIAEVTNGVTQDMIDNAIVKMRSQLYDDLGGFFGMGRADLLCSFALFDDDPARINNIESEFKKVTPELINKTVKEFLRSSNRTILTVNPLGSTDAPSSTNL